MDQLKLSNNYRFLLTEVGEEYRINNMPLSQLFYFLHAYRHYNKELTIDYIKKYYDLDVTYEIEKRKNDLVWINNKSIYERYLEINPYADDYSDDRNYFKNKGRSHYLKFVDWCGHLPEKDFLETNLEMAVVHHILPLSCGGTNRLENLLHISDFNHELLHMNPKENIEKYCHQAVVYAWYLQHPWISEKNEWFIEKYNLLAFKDRSPQFLLDMYKASLKEEMGEFYSRLGGGE